MGSALLVIRDNATGAIIEAVDVAILKCEDFTPVWKRWRPEWYASRRQQRRTSGRSTGAPWVQYHRTTERERYMHFKGSITGRALGLDPEQYRSRQFLHSLRPLTWPGKERLLPSLENPLHPDAIWISTEKKLTLGTRVPYARKHELGIGRAPAHLGGHRIPKRPMLRIGTYALRTLNDAVSDYAAEIATELGRTRVGYTSDQVRRRL